MNPLKQRTPGGDPEHDAKNKSAFNGEDYRHSVKNPQVACPQCAFYELIRRRNGHIYTLCHFTGLHDPQPGKDGCHFLYGRWQNIDSILGLTQGKSINNLDFPNVDRPSDCLYHAPHGENSGISDLKSHLPCHYRHEYKLAARRPVSVRTGGLSTTGERMAAFCILKSQNVEV